jgi:hypothetical protein
VNAGQVAWDECCDGQLWGRVVTITPHQTTQQGRGAVSMPPCGVDYLIATVAIGLIRCAASISDSGKSPSAGRLTADGYQQLDDMTAIERVILCDPRTLNVQSWNPLGPEGGCVGGEWTFTIALGACSCGNSSGPL